MIFTNFLNHRPYSFSYNLFLPLKLVKFPLTGFRASSPKAIDIELTNRCNLKCKMCWFYGEAGTGNKFKNDELSTEDLKKLIDQLSSSLPKIYLGGSEPFMRDDIIQILQHIKSHNLQVSFATNGTLFNNATLKTLVEMGVDDIKFSIDGDEELHDTIRGKGVYKKATQAIKTLHEIKQREHRDKPRITVNITISHFLLGKIESMLNKIKNTMGEAVKAYRLHHVWYITEKALRLHQNEVERILGVYAPGAKCHLIFLSHLTEYQKLADELNLAKRNFNFRCFPEFSYQETRKFYSENEVIKSRCLAPFFGAVIKPNGEVKFCPDEWIDDYVLGNIRKNTFSEIWNNEKARFFRKKIFFHKRFPGCKRCSWMYSF